jgi:acetyl esterase/lipase
MSGVDRRAVLGMSAALSGATALGSQELFGASPSQPNAPAQASAGAISLPARVVEPPRSISEAARAYLARGAMTPYSPPPPPGDAAAWKASVAAHEAGMLKMMNGGDLVLPGFKVEDRSMGGVPVYVVSPPDSAPNKGKPHMNIHGGGWTSLGGRLARVVAQVAAQALGGVVYAVDYRRPPDHPYPAPLDDCVAVYRELIRLHPPKTILVAGGSAGSNLAAAMLHRARDSGLPQPGCLFLDTPVIDLECNGDSLITNQYLDTLLKALSKEGNGLRPGGGYKKPLPFTSSGRSEQRISAYLPSNRPARPVSLRHGSLSRGASQGRRRGRPLCRRSHAARRFRKSNARR